MKKLLCIIFGFVHLHGKSQLDSLHSIDNHSDTITSEYKVPIFSTSGSDAESELDQQDVSSLLQASRDVFTQFASFQFGVSRYRIRGYSAENQLVMINGINVNNLETGFSSWSNWGGLNDVTRYTETRFGNGSNRYAYAGPGGYVNIDSKASSFKKSSRVSYGSANRIFRNRFMATHSTGMMANGWALTMSASSRIGNEVYIPGTYFNANAFYLSIDKRLNDQHLLSFTGFVAPIEQGRSGAEQQELFTLTGDNYYNSLWGYQNGKVRNSAVSSVKRPMLMLTHVFNIGPNSKWNTSIFYNFGTSGLTGLNWSDASNPRPNYYRYLPSYFYSIGDNSSAESLTQQWQTNINTQQIDWDRLIQLNRNNLYVLPSQLGQGINTSETRARYVLENKVEDLKNLGLNSVYNTRINKLFWSIGVNANQYRNRKYKIMEDLLGSTFWLDYDQFAENLGSDPLFQQNDISKPDNKIFKGDKFGYDYSINVNRAEMWSQVEYSFDKVDVYAGATISNYVIWREGYMANGKFPSTSKGESVKTNFLNTGAKAGAVYKITGRHFLVSNVNFFSRAPEASNLFISPRVRNDVVSNATNETTKSFDIGYEAKFPGFKMRLTYYHTLINNQIWVRTFWNDLYNNTTNLVMKGVNQRHQGLELGLEKTLFTSHIVQLAIGYGEFVYTSRPIVSAWQDNNNVSLYTDRTVYLKNYKVGGVPQAAAGIGYKYNAPKHWFIGTYLNYFDELYLEANPERRTSEAIGSYLSNESSLYAPILEQKKLPAYFVVNLNGGKSFRILKKYFLNVNLSINNLLNNKKTIVTGFEQLRWDSQNIKKFDNKYIYMQGTTYMLLINFNF